MAQGVATLEGGDWNHAGAPVRGGDCSQPRFRYQIENPFTLSPQSSPCV